MPCFAGSMAGRFGSGGLLRDIRASFWVSAGHPEVIRGSFWVIWGALGGNATMATTRNAKQKVAKAILLTKQIGFQYFAVSLIDATHIIHKHGCL